MVVFQKVGYQKKFGRKVNSMYPPHVLEIPEPKVNSEKTIFLDPTKYKFNIQTKKISIITKFFYWLLVR